MREGRLTSFVYSRTKDIANFLFKYFISSLYRAFKIPLTLYAFRRLEKFLQKEFVIELTIAELWMNY